MNDGPSDAIHNLTEAADGVRLEPGGEPLQIAGRLSAEILGTRDLGDKALEAIAHDVLYAALNGEALIEHGDGTSVVITAGDIVFVPAQARHRFTRLSPKFRTWRIGF